mmetsp:Transcript_21740/g.51703  ORF Transcript_21740/g.51703 Transcript_21740/m.51703 type:complete len:294 (+) Transcript_21740:1216-2097(+)
MPHLVELISCSQAARPRAHDDNPFVCSYLGRTRHHPAHLISLVNDGQLHGFDRHWIINDAKCAGTFARCWADPASEFWEVVGGHQPLERIEPGTLSDQVVPFRDEIPERASGLVRYGLVAEGRAAVHAAGSLGLNSHLVFLCQDFFKVRNTFLNSSLREVAAIHLQEASVGSCHQLGILDLLWTVSLRRLLEESHVFNVHADGNRVILEGTSPDLRLLANALLARMVIERLLRGEVLAHRAYRRVLAPINGCLDCGFEVLWEDTHKLGHARRPALQNFVSLFAVGPALMSIEE